MPVNDVSSARSGLKPERRLLDRQWQGQRLALEGEVGNIDCATGGDPVVALLVDVRHPRLDRCICHDGAGELVDVLELDGAADVGQIQPALDREIHVGIRDRRSHHQRCFDRIAANPKMKPVEIDHGAVGASARIGQRQIEEDRTGREREIGILERGVVHLGVQRERREGAVAVLALDPGVHRKVARRLHLIEITGVHRRHQREDAPEIGARRPECQIQPEQLADGTDRSRYAELEVVEAELGIVEDVGLLGEVGPGIGGEAELHPVEIGNAAEGHARGIGVEPSLHVYLGLAEVAAESLVVAAERRLELGLAVVESDVRILDLEAPETHIHRLTGVWGPATVFRDIPIRRSILQRDQRQPRLIQLDPPHHDRPAPTQGIREHARQTHRDTEVLHRRQRITLEAVQADGGEVVQGQGQIGKLPKEADADVTPIHLGLDVLVHGDLDPLGDLVLEHHRQDEQEYEEETEQGPGGGEDGTSFHDKKGKAVRR